ncbi:hypothetical protein [Streptomyces radicis]|uniref:Uncharacterized protein n=1 Tax=Streptomyces radicis TaxID=1750517 RepID=A0A3A9WH07_9ACTN|nr:hypothetical protein [Streptomyces radicis]RKN11593.1 hypothetical protein D7319_06655 [Streptomyces radicis]RKN26388.1 hypothetical protein D7318_03005 [Streptomyces radicis]
MAFGERLDRADSDRVLTKALRRALLYGAEHELTARGVGQLVVSAADWATADQPEETRTACWALLPALARALFADEDQAVLDDVVAWLTEREYPGPW